MDKNYQEIKWAVLLFCVFFLIKGGRHVDYVVDQVVGKLIEVVKKKNKAGVSVKPFQASNFIFESIEMMNLVILLSKLLSVFSTGEEPYMGFC